jgi:hypothetical protein
VIASLPNTQKLIEASPTKNSTTSSTTTSNTAWGAIAKVKSKKAKGESMKKLDVLNLVQSHQQELRRLGVKSLGLFGSVARDQATPQSDVDVLVELDESVGFFEFFQIKHYLEDLFQRPVDLGTTDALKEHLRRPILEEVIHVF